MRITRVMNLSLLNIIREHGEIDYYALRNIHVKPNPPGVISGQSACYDNDLKVLELEGKISIENNTIKCIE